MSQQINLYQRAAHKPLQAFDARMMAYVLLAVLALLALAYGYARWRYWSLGHELVRLGVQEAAAQRQVAELEQRHPARTKSRPLELEIQSLEAERTAKAHVLEALSGGGETPGNTQGFSRYLEGIAQRCPHGLWLTGISIAEGGARLTLTGSALRPELVPRFLQELSMEEAFAGKEFKVFQLKRDPGAPERIDFLMQTESGGGVRQ